MAKFEGAAYIAKGVPDYDEPEHETYRRIGAAYKWQKVLNEFAKARQRDRTLTRKNRWQWIRSHYPPPSMLADQRESPSTAPGPAVSSGFEEPQATQAETAPAPETSVEPDEADDVETAKGPTGWSRDEGSFKDEVLESVRWAYHNLPAYRRNRVKFSDAPSPGAWEMLETACDDPKWFQQNVVNTVLKKLDEIAEAQQLRDDNRPVLALLDRVLPTRKGTGVGLVSPHTKGA